MDLVSSRISDHRLDIFLPHEGSNGLGKLQNGNGHVVAEVEGCIAYSDINAVGTRKVGMYSIFHIYVIPQIGAVAP